MISAIKLIIFGGTSSASGSGGGGTGDGSMDFSIATGDDTGLIALMEDI